MRGYEGDNSRTRNWFVVEHRDPLGLGLVVVPTKLARDSSLHLK